MKRLAVLIQVEDARVHLVFYSQSMFTRHPITFWENSMDKRVGFFIYQ